MRSALLGAGMRQRLARQVRGPARPAAPPAAPVRETDLDGLPAAAQRWLRASGAVGRPPDRAVTVHWAGRFRLRPGQRWMPLEAWQHTGVSPVRRVYRMRIDVAGVLPVFATDSYVDGRGRMRGRLLGLLPVADGSGPEFDVGELVTWLDDAVLLAPSMLLAAPVTWRAVDAGTFEVSLTDAGLTATVRVRLDETGKVHDVATDDRWCALPSGLVRARWTTRVDGWTTVDGRPVPLHARAFWDLPGGRWTYASVRLRPRDLRRDEGLRAAGDEGLRAAGDEGRGRIGDLRPWDGTPGSASLDVPVPTYEGDRP